MNWLLRGLGLGALCFLSLVSGERVVGSFGLTEKDDDRVHYITKFACNIGECQYRIRAALDQHYGFAYQALHRLGVVHPGARLSQAAQARLMVRVILDEEWDSSHKMTPCKRIELGRGRTTVSVPLNGTFGPWATNTFRQSYRAHFW